MNGNNEYAGLEKFCKRFRPEVDIDEVLAFARAYEPKSDAERLCLSERRLTPVQDAFDEVNATAEKSDKTAEMFQSARHIYQNFLSMVIYNATHIEEYVGGLIFTKFKEKGVVDVGCAAEIPARFYNVAEKMLDGMWRAQWCRSDTHVAWADLGSFVESMHLTVPSMFYAGIVATAIEPVKCADGGFKDPLTDSGILVIIGDVGYRGLEEKAQRTFGKVDSMFLDELWLDVGVADGMGYSWSLNSRKGCFLGAGKTMFCAGVALALKKRVEERGDLRV